MNRTPIGWTHGLTYECPSCDGLGEVCAGREVEVAQSALFPRSPVEKCKPCEGEGRLERVGYTWNPLRGCSRVSPGCVHCYAETMAARFSAPGLWAEGYAKRDGGKPRWTRKVDLVPEKLADPLKVKAPGLVFANSMSDLFHESLSNEEIAAIFGVMAAADWHIFQCLTKRAKRMREWFEWIGGQPFINGDPADNVLAYAGEALQEAGSKRAMNQVDGIAYEAAMKDLPWPLSNVWLGTSAEDQERWDERVPELLRCPAAVRFVSAEPLLGPLRIQIPCRDCKGSGFLPDWADGVSLLGGGGCCLSCEGTQRVPAKGLDQVIVGAESGHGARPMKTEWAAAIVDQCAVAGTACYMKQFATPVGRKITDPAKMPRGAAFWPQELPEVAP